jgi:hypothetical protein
MTDVIEDLRRRVEALEAAQNDSIQTLRWVVAKLGTVAAVQDEHTLLLEKTQADIASLRRDLPGMLTEAVREGIKKQ